MRIAVKPVITTSVALVGASVIAITPIEAPAPTVPVVQSDVSLSASSVAYVPINMVQQVLSSPANMAAAMDRLAAALVISGSWNENHANNQWGWDEANPAMLKELINMAIPFPAFSEPWGRHLNWWATANLPMYEGCNFDCPDLPGMLDRMFKVPMSEFYDEDGYTFPVVKTPFNGEETPWSEQTVKLDPAEPLRSVWDSLTAEPTGIKTTTLWEFVTAAANLGAALQITGHMPDWIAVREIETFFKHFLRPPVEEDPETPSGATELSFVSPALLSPAATDAEVVDVAADDVPDETTEKKVTETTSDEQGDKPDAPTIVDTATNFLKGKFALAEPEGDTEDAEEAADVKGAAAEDDSDESDASTDDEASSSRVKHRKSGDSDSGSGSDASSASDSDSGGSGGSAGSGGSGGGDSDS
ncbi:hypothetical protein [Mycobacterium sp. 236(2023)]|uniref:hypothetical protein n=1 Tax=Mycobacterium sp. 236(2023) TaxID=3038163 RepID=UPI002415499C|nr:hypothetical protein [Mycobacterium sp. 236(2023)]MDG4666907.1 hypothetical protein [Mycobacterium sp. 236(2023)]